jgi:uncharacterized protein (TIGR02996 family)
MKSEYRPFIEAIIRTPNDLGLRLIFADFLEERGDPYGEFIRVQIELDEIGPEPQQLSGSVYASKKGNGIIFHTDKLLNIGDRIDADVWSPVGRFEETLHNLVVVERVRPRESYWYRLKRDRRSKPYPKDRSDELRARERELFGNKFDINSFFPEDFNCWITLSEPPGYGDCDGIAATIRRGFAEHISCSALFWLSNCGHIHDDYYESPCREADPPYATNTIIGNQPANEVTFTTAFDMRRSLQLGLIDLTASSENESVSYTAYKGSKPRPRTWHAKTRLETLREICQAEWPGIKFNFAQPAGWDSLVANPI